MKISKLTQSFLLMSSCCVLLTLVRIGHTGSWIGLGFVWNLFLAWVPLACALVIRRLNTKNRLSLSLAALWLLFLPNSPYIITDLVHLKALPDSSWWFDATYIFLLALTGLAVGIYSLLIMHFMWKKWWNRTTAHILLISSLLLNGFGIYLGRFVRLNSWDIVANPLWLAKETIAGLHNNLAIKTTLLFTLVIGTVYLAVYHIFKNEYSKTH